MGDRVQRLQLMPLTDGPQPRRRFFHGRYPHPPPRFEGLMVAANVQQWLGLPSTFPWTAGPTLPTEPSPYYFVQRPYSVVTRFPSLPPWIVPAVSYEHGIPWPQDRSPDASPDVTTNGTPPRLAERQLVKSRGSQPPVEKGTEVVRSQATRVRSPKSATPSRSKTSRSSPSKEEEEYIELVLSRLLRTVADLGLGVPAKKEEPRCSTSRLVYSAAMLRSLNVSSRVPTPASKSEPRDENPE
ncbi:hypothetical protein HPB51_018827 [Rhipicephalus microplus]|uniref:Uncharacterized protein n=1 Tax=Rhipicephalus microplus TaxID=6941 RepID=A0A9J6DBB9_RHIMP|nr:hypothetical protein HPB51_018827 [Rhipicephalus microplus]